MRTQILKVLLVEDNPADDRLIRELVLQVPGARFDFDSVVTVSDARNRLDAEAYDAMLLDLTLPDSSGLDTLRAVRDAPAAIVVLTGMNDEELAVLAMREGAQDYLEKGRITGETLVRTIRYARERKSILEALEASEQGLELLVEERTAELHAANEYLREAIAAKSRLLSNMSHELRTPLGSVIGFSDLMLKQDGDAHAQISAEHRQYLELINGAGRHLLSIVNDLLDLGRLEAGKVQVSLAPTDLTALARESLALVSPLAESKGLELRSALDEEPVTIVTDRQLAVQILVNLLSNAIKYTSAGYVEIRLDVGDSGVTFRVTDTGVGIAPADMQRIFEEFIRLDNALSGGSGTGLGLAISRRLAGLLKGEITASSAVGEGSVFELRLPRRQEGAGSL